MAKNQPKAAKKDEFKMPEKITIPARNTIRHGGTVYRSNQGTELLESIKKDPKAEEILMDLKEKGRIRF